MKTETFKNLIKKAVKEAIQEELKDLLLEAIKSPSKGLMENSDPKLNFNDSIGNTSTPLNSPPPTSEELRQKYMSVLGETAKSFSTQDITPFNPSGVNDPINGNLGTGEVGMDQINSLLNGSK